MLNDWTGNRFMKHPYGVERNLENAYMQMEEMKEEKKDEKVEVLREKEEMRLRRKKRKSFQQKNKKPWMKSSMPDIKIQSR